MRRAHIVIASTVIGLAAVLGYRPNVSGNSNSLMIAAASSTGSGGRSGGSAAGNTTARTGSSDTTTASDTRKIPTPAPTSPSTPTPTPAPAPTPGKPSPTPKPAPNPVSNRTVLGSTEQISEYGRQFGVLQAKVTLKGSRITDISFNQINVYDGRSAQIANYAVPRLIQQTISAQSASIDGISGATYTSQAYEASVQSALDHARA